MCVGLIQSVEDLERLRFLKREEILLKNCNIETLPEFPACFPEVLRLKTAASTLT